MDILTLLDELLVSLSYLAVCFVLFLIGKFIYQLFHKSVKVGHELVEKDNLAFSLAYTGYYIGLILAIGSALIGESDDELWYVLAEVLGFGIGAIILLNVSIIINDKIILRGFSIKKEIIDEQNAGTGIIEGANAIATGFILLGAISGDGGNHFTALIFWVVGQLLLVLTAYVYNLITPYNIHDYIEKGNVAVGIGFAGAMVAISILISNGLNHDFESYLISLEIVGVEVGFGLLFLPVARLATDKILLPGQNLTDEIINQEHPNIGAAIIEAFAYISGAILITWSVG